MIMSDVPRKTTPKPAASSKTGMKPAAKPTQAAKPVQKPASAVKPVQKPATADKPVQKPAQAAKAAVKPMAKPGMKPAGAQPLVIKMDENAIREMAYDFSQQPKSYDDFVWLLAENELRLIKSYTTPSNPLMGNFPETVSIFPNKIIDFPPTDEIKRLAEIIAAQGISLQDLHWFLAERFYIYQSAKPKK